jgi:hypothetical protein
VVGAFYRPCGAEALEGGVELAEERGLALDEEAIVGAVALGEVCMRAMVGLATTL